jgi:ketosteroid isomerase-like protein
MNEQQNVKTIQEVYAAFGRGDVAFIVTQLTGDIRW